MAKNLFSVLLLLLPFLVYAQQDVVEDYRKVNGVNLYFKVYGKGEPLLIVQGGPGMNMEYIEPHLQYLSKHYKLIFFDPRSTGKSDIPTDSNATEHKYLINDIEGIRKSFNISKLNILAHSWGAKIALHYALQYPNNIRSIVLASPSALGNVYDSIQLSYSNNRSVTPGFFEKKKEIMYRHTTTIEIKQRLAFLMSFYLPESIDKINLTYPLNYGDAQRALFRGLSHDYRKYDVDFYAALKSVKAPVLIIHGQYDAVPLKASEKLQQSLGNATLLTFTKSGHFPFLEEPQLFEETITNFLKNK